MLKIKIIFSHGKNNFAEARYKSENNFDEL